MSLLNAICTFNRITGQMMRSVLMALVFVQFAIVLFRYIFSYNHIFIQESIMYMFASISMFAAAYTYLRDEHIRIDIIYTDKSSTYKAWVNLLGTLFLLFPTMGTITWFSFGFVADAWAIQEGSVETYGIHFVYLLKTTILFFALQMLTQGIVVIYDAWGVIRGKSQDIPTRYQDT